jgi:class 3 adenylate cyclase
MTPDAWIAVGASFAVILGAALAGTHFLVRAPLEAERAKVEAEGAASAAARADAERRLESERRHLADLDNRYRSLRQDFASLREGKTGALLKRDIEEQLIDAMDHLGVDEASILVPDSAPGASSFVFLVVQGPAAPKLRLAKPPIDRGIVGRVFRTATTYNTSNARHDPDFFAGIDEKSEHLTRTMLTIPLTAGGEVVGVAQFLNKPGGFDSSDEVSAEDWAAELAPRVRDFVRSRENFELLGLAGDSRQQKATIVFCDLTSSSVLFDQMNMSSAVDCINEYLEQQCGTALSFGGTIGKYLGDGAMLCFNVPRPIRDDDHVVCAVEAAIRMQEQFERLRSGWLSEALPVQGIFNRIGVATGRVVEAKIGHSQFQEVTVIGDPVNEAANLCESAGREKDTIIVSETLAGALRDRFDLTESDASHGGRAGFELVRDG